MFRLLAAAINKFRRRVDDLHHLLFHIFLFTGGEVINYIDIMANISRGQACQRIAGAIEKKSSSWSG